MTRTAWPDLARAVDIAWTNLHEHIDCSPPDLEGVRRALEGLIRSINPRLSCTVSPRPSPGLDYSRKLQTLRFRLQDNELDVLVSDDLQHAGLRGVIMGRAFGPLVMLAMASKAFEHASADLLCEVGDEAYGCGIGFCSRHDGCVLVPDSDFFMSGGYADFRRSLSGLPPWEARDDRIVWRGSSTGIPRHTFAPTDADPLAWLPRADLCRRLRSGRYGHRADTYISNIVQIDDPSAIEAMHDAKIVAGGIAKTDFANAKIIVDIDGNSNAWSGLLCSLLLGSCVLKVQSEHGFKQWYYNNLEAWVHYVPVASDLSDIEEKIDWVFAFDHVAKAIGQQGANFAANLTFEAGISETVTRLARHLSLSSY